MKQLLIALAAIALFSCYNTKTAIKQTNHALVFFPAVVAKIARTAFPCISLKSDTVITNIDTVVIVDCPDFKEPDSVQIKVHDTVKIGRTTIKVPVTLPIRTITILKVVEDSAKIKMLQSGIDARDLTIAKLQKDNGSLNEAIKRKNKWILYLWLAVALSIVGIILKLLIKFK